VNTVYEIGPFRLDPEAGVLVRAGLPMPLGSRAVAVLTALVKEHNEFVPKEIILDAAWPNVVVEESNLAVQIRRFMRLPMASGKHRDAGCEPVRLTGTEVRGSLPRQQRALRDSTCRSRSRRSSAASWSRSSACCRRRLLTRWHGASADGLRCRRQR
jgi:hypothetical protein